ncbi:hypothetical protein EGT07_14880 [Herbaspirillum sp. HC18]|nr:hypothetical protein EGT07_14880 [Herbaspirillum sp. HC18]
MADQRSGEGDGRTSIYLLPPVRDSLIDYLAESGFSNTRAENLPFPELPLLATDSETRPAYLSSTVKPVFVAAAKLAESEGKIIMARRLEKAALGWLSNALEVHVAELNVHGDWPWRLLGATRTVPASLMRWLPDCTNLPEPEVLRGFEALRPLWSFGNGREDIPNSESFKAIHATHA